MATIGVALSGGGHRATVWAFGVLLYLADAGQQDRAAITSVSGGSIANGVVATSIDYGKADGDKLRNAIRPAVRHVAHEGPFCFGPATNAYVYGLFAVVVLTAVALLAAAVLAVTVGGLPVVVAGVAALVLLAWRLWIFSRRSLVADRALGKVHFERDGRPVRLAEVDRPLAHIFCATELQAGNHVYFAPSFVNGYRHGIGEPGDLTLSTAVQCSACLPGAFVPRRLPIASHRFRRVAGVTEPAEVPPYLVVNDGGVYDNMGDEWFAGYADRRRAWPGLPMSARQSTSW